MLLKTVQASAIKSCFEVLKEALHDVNLYFNKDGVAVTALDNAKVALINLKLDAQNFEEYKCDETVQAGINVSNFFKILKVITTNDILTLEMNSSDRLLVTIENDTKNSTTKFDLALLWINEDMLQLPEIKPNCTTIMPSVDFQRICRDMGNIGQEISIYREKNLLKVSCHGDFATQETVIDTEQNDFNDRIGNIYSLKYINMFTKATGMCSNMKIRQTFPTEKMPISFSYDVANLGSIEFYLVARLDDV